MAPLAAADRLRPSLLARGWVALASLALLGGAVHGQDDVYHSRQLTFRIPFQTDPGDRRVQEILLHVSEDLGRTYQLANRATPAAGGFTYTARRDGWYYFAVQTMDFERRLHPPTVDNLVPGLRVFVDTVAPDVRLRPLTGLRPGEVGFEWDLRDEALDVGSIRVEYRTPGQFWQERVVQRAVFGSARWDPGVPGLVEVRLQVKDRAGNLGESVVRVPVGTESPMRPADPPTPPGGGGGYPDRDALSLRKINSTRISLNYRVEDVGPSKVSVIEIWKTRDGKSWQRHPKDAELAPPIVIDVEGEGRWGITLVAKSGVGLGEASPRPGDEPQLWVEVDLTKPDVKILDAVVGRGPETGSLTITWTASDRNLGGHPISLYYATQPEGPWQPVPGGRNIDNSGRFVWRMQSDVPYEFFLRVEAADEAGNIGQADTAQSVKVDLSLPKARVIGVEPARQ